MKDGTVSLLSVLVLIVIGVVASFLAWYGGGGSETGSNILFLDVQREATASIGLEKSFMTIYGSHAVAGGIASAVTPAKINNAVVTIDETREVESQTMRRHLVIAVLLTMATGILTGLFVTFGA